MCNPFIPCKTRWHTSLVAALVLTAGLAAVAPSTALAVTAYFSDTFDLPGPGSPYGRVFNGEHVPNGSVDTGLGTADRSYGLQLDNGDTSLLHPSYACVGSGCPSAGHSVWSLYFDPTDQPGVYADMWYDFGSAPADFTAGGRMALDFAGYDTTSSTASGQVTFITPGGASATVPFDLPDGVQQSTASRLLLDYSGLSVDLSNISLMIVGLHFVGSGGSFSLDRISTVPVPASVLLFLSGLAAFGGLARRRPADRGERLD